MNCMIFLFKTVLYHCPYHEPVYMHIRKDSNKAKFWLDGSIAYNKGFGSKELQNLQKLVVTNKSRIEEVWNEHFGEQ